MGQNYFSGSNSGAGFHNYFDGIVPPWASLSRHFMIKGGPGVGKSTLMKRVAERAEEAGEVVERFYCSGDPDSLDGIRLVHKGIVITDATSPHAADPCFPGAVEEIVNLGEQIARGRIAMHRDAVEKLTKQNKESYRRGYAFLGAAAVLEAERYRQIAECVDRKRLVSMAKELAGPAGENKKGQARRLFLDAISCKGYVSFAAEREEENTVYRIVGDGREVIVDLLSAEFSTEQRELFCSPLRPQCVKHLLLREQKLFLTSADGMEGTALCTEDFLQRECHRAAGRYAAEARILEAEAMECFGECKKIHDELEGIYKECVDFSAISERTERLLAWIAGGE